MYLELVLVTVVLGLIYWLLRRPFNYWRVRGVPGPEPTIVVGNFGPSLTFHENLGQIYKRIYEEYDGLAYVGIYKFQKPSILLRDMELIKQVIIKDFASFHDNDVHMDEKNDFLFGNNPFCLKGEKWKVMRSLITTGITSGRIKGMFALMKNVSKTLIDYLDVQSATSSPDGLEVREVSAKFTTDVVASCAFGLDANSFTDHDEFRKMGKKFLNTSFLTSVKILFVFAMPTLTRWLKFKFIPEEVAQWFRNVLKQTSEFRKKNDIHRPDYLDLLISLKGKKGNFEFGDEQVLAQAMTFYGDGFETSSIALSYTLYELASHPEIQERLRQEIEVVLANHDGELSYEAIQDMKYLDMCSAEGLRKHTPGLYIVRLCTQAYTLPPPGGPGTGPPVVVEPGMPMVVSSYGIHYDPKYYPDPERFDPERFTEEEKNKRPKCSNLSFGEGPRICIGARFALMQTKVAIVQVIRNFELSVNPKTQRPLVVEPRFFMMSAIGGLWLNFKRIQRK